MSIVSPVIIQKKSRQTMTNNGAIINEDVYVSEEDPDESPEKDVLFRLD